LFVGRIYVRRVSVSPFAYGRHAAPPWYVYTHTTHTHTHARAHTHTHTHTHTQVALVYVLSGVFGNVFSSFVEIEAAAKEGGATLKLGVGASGSVLGLVGGNLAFLWSTWSRRDADQRRARIIDLLISLVITFAVGTAAPSKIDNWAHFGGLAAGFSFGLLMHLRNFPAACVKSRVFALLLGALGVVMMNFFQKSSM